MVLDGLEFALCMLNKPKILQYHREPGDPPHSKNIAAVEAADPETIGEEQRAVLLGSI